MQRTNHIKAITCCLTSKWHRKAAPAGRLPGHTLTTLLLLLLFGTTTAFAQDYSGVYYIGSNGYNSANTTTNYYLCPTENWFYYQSSTPYYQQTPDNGKPFMTTYQCRNGSNGYTAINAVWIIQKETGTNYYHIRRAIDGKYLTRNAAMGNSSNVGRMRIHLDESPVDDNDALFEIIWVQNKSCYDIKTKKNDGATGDAAIRQFLNINSGNKNTLQASTKADGPNGIETGGILGLYKAGSASDNNAKWYLESTLLSAPTITYNYSQENDNFTVSITDNNSLPAGYDILYTTNGYTPSIGGATTSTYTNSITITNDCTVKAVVARYGAILTEVASISIERPNAPTITPPSDCSNMVEISADDGTIIYYTLDGTNPDNNSTLYSGPFAQDQEATIKAIAYNGSIPSNISTCNFTSPYTVKPTIIQNGTTITITGHGSIYYTTDGSEPNTNSTLYTNAFTLTGTNGQVITIKAVSKDGSKGLSCVAEKTVTMAHFINDLTSLQNVSSNPGDLYILTADIDASNFAASISSFTGVFDGDFHTICGLTKPLFSNLNGATVKNVILDNVDISGGTDAGAICNVATGSTRIYNCGVLATRGSTVSGSGHVGGLVGTLSGNARVINCYSFANVSGGSYTAGIVGYNSVATTQNNVGTAGMVMNCMFYGDITGGANISPVYGGELIDNAGTTGVNNYNYYRRNRYDRETDTYVDDVTFDDNNFSLADYHRSWPADAKYLTRFEYYRSILNSNKKLCTWWINGTNGTAPTDQDIEEVGIAKWVLDPGTAPYPILKKWGKYPSVINHDPDKRFDPSTKAWENRADASANWGKDMAPDMEGQKLGTLIVTIKGGDYHSGSSIRSINITAMDTLYNDYCYGKIQLPYYNEIFGNPDGDTWNAKYGDNYTAHVVTGWDISGGSTATDYNFADRNSYSGRVFAQGGYFYVPKGVTSITITAHWADAVYLCNKDYSIDRVNVAAGVKEKNGSDAGKVAKYGSPFTPAGTIASTFQGQTVYTTIQDAINNGLSTTGSGKDVYNQAIVLIGNVQVRNHSYVVNLTGDGAKPFTLMSADLDFDNEPDNCLELQFRNDIDRPGIQPIRFDFLPVPELGLAIRTNKLAYAIGIMIPLGHFEITETAFMHTTQFEYDANVTRSGKSPVIINGGEHEMFTVRKHASNRTSYFLLGGNAWIHRFAPGAHPNIKDKPSIYLCPINVIGGEIKELYLSGLYRPELAIPNNQGNPLCYIDGGKFGTIAGAGYDKVSGSVTFKIDHSLIGEFYGGGINGTNPIGGNIDVTINNSRVNKYCGGPKVGDMTGKTITTQATGTTFGVFYGGGNGGNTYYRELQRDGDFASSYIGNWTAAPDGNEPYNYDIFNPLNLFTSGDATAIYDEGADNKGYHAEYEFEVFSQSNGLSDEITQRGFIHWIQFGITTTGDIESTLNNCKVLGNFYGGGNLASVSGNVTSTLTDTQVDGNVFGAGYSAAIPTFQVHDKDNASFPSMDDAGTITDGYIAYGSRVYEWTNNLDGEAGHDPAYMKAHPTYQKDGKWYCYTWNSLENLGVVTGKVTLNIEGNTLVIGNVTEDNLTTQSGGVFGGGDASGVDGDTEVKIDASGQKNGYTYNTCNVFGGGNKADVSGNTSVELTGSSKVQNNVYGGGNLAGVNGSTTVNIKNGTVINDVYGGGMKGNVDGAVTVYIGKSDGSGTVSIGHDVYGGGKLAHTNMGNLNNDQSITTNINTTQVYLNPGATIGHDVYGGGRGEKPTQNNPGEAIVYGDVSVFQYGAVLIPAYDSDGLATSGRIFGCNNVNGTPKGHVLVDVEITAKYPSSTDKYDLAAVYGGGNEAEFFPYYHEQDNSETTEVVINGCNIVSIHSVYGGGNAASTPATDVKIRGAKEIEFVYGGGNGAGTINGEPNPGANVGYKYFPDNISGPDQVEQRSSYKYGSGLAVTEIYGGTIHYVYGGSNTKGNVRKTSVARLEELGDCPLQIDEIYGGGRAAFMDGSASLELGCISGLDEIYGGSERADIGKDVVLTITSGKYDKVFGGNNVSGHIFGSITVNIEQTGCLPIEIGELYGGGNLAPYSVYGYDGNDLNYELQTGSTAYADPQINIKSFKSIGTVYGGGYKAEMVGNPHININVVKGWTNGEYKDTEPEEEDDYAEYKDTPKNMPETGLIGTVFGGGNDADVVGQTFVNIGTESSVTVHDVTKDVYNIIKNGRSDISNPQFTESDNGSTTKNLTITVEGATITGNVYGGGNNANVTQGTNITIGQ